MSNIKLLLISTGVLLVLTIMTGISYALWLLTEEQTNSNVLATECLDIEFVENTDSNINLQGSYPLLDSEGKELSPYTFSVTNTCDLNTKYFINIEVLDTTTLSHDLIKIMIDNKIPSVVTTNDIVTSTIENSTSYTIETDYLAYNETNNHEFRMWIDESGTLENSQNKIISAKIVVSAEPIDDLPYDYNLEFPVLDIRMIPVMIADDGDVIIADSNSIWFDYGNSEWANAVIVDSSFTTLDPGTIIPMESIEQMYVWIPRYEYSKSSITSAEDAIEINFVSINTVNNDIENNDVIVHPAFTFGGVEQAGLWVGKFEMGFDDGEDENVTNVEYVIKPNVNSVQYTSISTMFDKINNTMNIYSMDEVTDVHLIKNTEWGAVTYLSQSKYGICEDDISCSVKVENNSYYNGTNDNEIVTGCGGSDVINNVTLLGVEICPVSNRWETTNGVKASTTHNLTGVYDMAGGRSEYVMGNMQDSSSNFYSIDDGFTIIPDSKYYDSYKYGTSYSDYSRGLYGDATKELNSNGNTMYYWNGDNSYFVQFAKPWFIRSGPASVGSKSGIWLYDRVTGGGYVNGSTRAIISFN